MNTDFSRRNFLKGTVAIGMPAIIPSSALGLAGTVAPSNRIAMAAIGIGPRGRMVLDAFLKQPDAQFVSVCDVQQSNRRTARMMVDRAYKNEGCHETPDMLEVFAREDIDAVLIATGDRWHAIGSILAAKAGKDVYSEKPCSLTIAESRELDETMKLYGRVFQAGTQRRSVPNFHFAAELARSGKLGNIHTVHAAITARTVARDWLPEEPLPPKEEVDWDRWLGPAPWRPYNIGYLRGRWHGYQDFEAGGMFLDWAVHTVDQCQWALGMDGTTPVEFEPVGDEVHARYANGIKLVMRIGGFGNEGKWLGLGTCPVRYEGDAGWVETGDHGKVAAEPASLLAGGNIEGGAGTDPTAHIRNFLDCVKSRDLTVCNSSVARSSHVAGHAAAIARELGRKLRFDPVTESFVNDEQANRLCRRAHRAPWHA